MMQKIDLKFMKKYLLMFLCVLTIFSQLSFIPKGIPVDKAISIIPYPKAIEKLPGNYLVQAHQLSVSLPDEFKKLLPVISGDVEKLFNRKLMTTTKSKANISIELLSKLPAEAYELAISNSISIKAGSYHAALMAWSSLLQLANEQPQHLSFPKCIIKDEPDLQYRGLLLDLARKFQSIPSIKNTIESCRWYKINYLQLHLNDDDLFVFPSQAFPKLATAGKSYTVAELKELVEYASVRGVTLVPEFDAPAHTGSLRKAYPELFGAPDLRIIDLGNPKVLEACKVIVAEMMKIFNTSPYFHIGADEVNLERFNTLASTAQEVQRMGFDNPHDLYLHYIAEMHKFVKSKGFKTLAWEGFSKDGSEKIKIPKDIIVFAWESFYQRPDELIDNGFQIMNASWKPIYITPEKRWKQVDVYNWNIWRWENFNKKAPSFNPIQLEGAYKDKVLGTQMCAWEMTEEMNLPSILNRLPALSEIAWKLNGQKDYEFFKKRYELADQKLKQLLFPAKVVKTGLSTGKMDDRFYNRENYFSNSVQIQVKPLLSNVSTRYTLNGKVPTLNDRELKGSLQIDSTSILRLALYSGKQLIGYSTELLEKRPIALSYEGAIEDKENAVDGIVNFKDKLHISVNKLNAALIPRYTLDGTVPTKQSEIFNRAITTTSDTNLKIQCFNTAQMPEGALYQLKFKKIND